MFLSHVIRFKLDEPGKDTTMDGRDIAFVVSQTDINRCVTCAPRAFNYLIIISLQQISANRGSESWSQRQDKTGYVQPLGETIRVKNLLNLSLGDEC